MINHNPGMTNDIKVFARDDDKVEGREEYPTGYTPDILLQGQAIIS